MMNDERKIYEQVGDAMFFLPEYAYGSRTMTNKDCVSREELVNELKLGYFDKGLQEAKNDPCVIDAMVDWAIRTAKRLPPATPKFTDEEIQKMQELEQAQLDKAYELGKTESFEEWLSSFSTESATACFTAVQELKKKLGGKRG